MEVIGQTVFGFATWVAFACLLVAFACTVYRLMRGPSFADRVVALDFLMLIGIGFITVKAVVSSEYSYIDVAIAMALVGFLATVAFSRYIYRRAKMPSSEKIEEVDEGTETSTAGRPAQGGDT